MRKIVPAWARNFNNQPRHCWEGRDGIRFLDNRAPEYDHESSDPSQTCTVEHDPKRAGEVEWLRFVRAFHTAVLGGSPFAPDDLAAAYFLLNESDGHTTSEGRLAYCESYLRKNPNDWGLKAVFRVFLDNEAGWSRIECYDENLVGECEIALAAVEASYKVADGVTGS